MVYYTRLRQFPPNIELPLPRHAKQEQPQGGGELEFDVGVTRIFRCPFCSVDTPHSVKGRRGNMYGIVCTNCRSGSVVSDVDLRIYQLKWEEELQAILDSLIDDSFGLDDE